FIGHDAEEALAGMAIIARFAVFQRLDKTDQGGKRRPEFMTGIGDEIDAHLLGDIAARAIRETYQPAILAEIVNVKFPMAVGFPDPDQFDRTAIGPCKPFGSGWVANGEPDIFANDMSTQQAARGFIGH